MKSKSGFWIAALAIFGFSSPLQAQTVVEFSEVSLPNLTLLDGTDHFAPYGLSFEDQTFVATDSRCVGAGTDSWCITTTGGENNFMTVVFETPASSVIADWAVLSALEIKATAFDEGGNELDFQSQITEGLDYGAFTFTGVGAIKKITFSDGTGQIGVGRLEFETDALDDSVATFNVTKKFTDLRTDDVEVTLTCNGGLPLTQSFNIAGEDPVGVTFTVTNIPESGADCTVTESGSPTGYTPSYDSGTAVSLTSCAYGDVLGGRYSCVITNTPDDATYTVALNWVLDDAGAEESTYEVPVTITCDTEILSVDVIPDSQTTNQVVVTLDDGDDVTVTVETEAGDTACSASQAPTQSGVESEASSACGGANLSAGGSATCTFTNTVFFEGIPTLSQYGLALMALLMLGVGFVGMRRFV